MTVLRSIPAPADALLGSNAPAHVVNLGRSPSSVTVAVDVHRIGGNGPWTLDD